MNKEPHVYTLEEIYKIREIHSNEPRLHDEKLQSSLKAKALINSNNTQYQSKGNRYKPSIDFQFFRSYTKISSMIYTKHLI